VTQAEFEGFLGYPPACYDGCADCPVECLTWHEAAAFANAVSDATGLDSCYSCSWSGDDVECAITGSPYACAGYRLPTEAEWEYAARAGTGTAFSNGGNLLAGTEYDCSAVELDNGAQLGDIAVFCGNDPERPEEVGTKAPNPWGLYDMHGNVWEWVGDSYASYDGAATDPFVDEDGAGRQVRGGGWRSTAQRARSASRLDWYPGNRFDFLGFRLARAPAPSRGP
jgi:formylglycine-generating enzyme required for sulfatase activity